MLVILVKTLDPSMVGQFSLGLALSAPVLMFFNLQLRALQATSVFPHHEPGDFLSLRLLTSATSLITVGIIGLILGYAVPTLMTILAVTLYKCLDSLADTVYGHLQSGERMDRIAFSLLGRGALALMIFGAAVTMTREVVFGALALAVSSLAVLLLYDLRAGALSLRFSRQRMMEIAKTGLPLGVASLLLVLATNVPRLVLERLHGEVAVGFYSALAYPTVALSILLNALGQASTPRLAHYFRWKRASFWLVVAMLAAVPIVAGLIAIMVARILGGDLLAHMYTPDYARYSGTFVMLLIAGIVWSLASVLGYAATAAGCLSTQAPIAGATCLVAFLAAIYLIPRGGIDAAAMTSVIAGLTGLGFYAFLLGKRSVAQASKRVPVIEGVRSAGRPL